MSAKPGAVHRAYLLWMADFASIETGETNDAPDVIAVTPGGNIIVVECTTGGLKTDGKLQKLIDRRLELEEHLKDANATYLHVLAMMVTTRPRAELGADLADFERLKIMVVSKDELDAYLKASVSPRKADAVFDSFKLEVEQKFKSREGIP